MMNRREAVTRLIAITGGMVIGGEFLMSGCARFDKRVKTDFTPADIALLDEIGETILPTTTDSPGAKAAGVGAFMAKVVNDCYDDDAHVAFERGLEAVDKASRKRHDKPFMESTPAERTALLNEIDREAREHARTRKRDEDHHYFRMMRELTLVAYFSSEIGATKALRYVESPGAYRDEPYAKGDKAWFNPSRRLI
jgi:hypothetical protein